jgi:hypothetical protein
LNYVNDPFQGLGQLERVFVRSVLFISGIPHGNLPFGYGAARGFYPWHCKHPQ